MKNLLRQWPRLNGRIAGSHLLLLLDYDGTLTPLRARPQQAVLSARMRRVLRALAAKPEVTLALVSGRDFADLKCLAALKGVIYASNHGFKISGRGIRFEAKSPAQARKALAAMRRELVRLTGDIKGALVEHKKFSVALHYRLVSGQDLPALKRIFNGLVPAYEKHGFVLKPGKKVFEILLPCAQNKGSAAEYIFKATALAVKPKPVVPVFIGDDTTDEDAFRALAGSGITVRVGQSGNSAAAFYLRDTDGVYQFLSMLLRD